jgi:hypothetical protein
MSATTTGHPSTCGNGTSGTATPAPRPPRSAARRSSRSWRSAPSPPRRPPPTNGAPRPQAPLRAGRARRRPWPPTSGRRAWPSAPNRPAAHPGRRDRHSRCPASLRATQAGRHTRARRRRATSSRAIPRRGTSSLPPGRTHLRRNTSQHRAGLRSRTRRSSTRPCSRQAPHSRDLRTGNRPKARLRKARLRRPRRDRGTSGHPRTREPHPRPDQPRRTNAARTTTLRPQHSDRRPAFRRRPATRSPVCSPRAAGRPAQRLQRTDRR